MPDAATLGFRTSQIIGVQGYDGTNAAIASPWFWTSANPSIASVASAADGTATLFGTGLGTTTVTATAANGVTATASVTVLLGDVLVYDSFSGANGTPLPAHAPEVDVVESAWLPLAYWMPVPHLQNNQAASVGGMAYAPTVIETATADVRVSANVHLTNGLAQMVVRATDDQHYLLVQAYDSWLRVFRAAPNGMVLIGAAGASTASGSTHRLEVTASGSTIQGLWDGVQIIEITETAQQTGTRHGLMWPSYDGGATFDDFEIRGVVPPVARIVVIPANVAANLGGARTFTAQAFDATDAPMPAAFHWSLSDPSAAGLWVPGGLSSSASIFGVMSGTVVTATALSGASASASVSVDATGTLVVDAFSDADGTPLTAHAPDASPGGAPWITLGLRAGAAGLLALRVQDPDHFLVAGYGLGGYPLAIGQYVNGALYLLRSAPVPTAVPGAGPHRVEAHLAGAHIVVTVDGATMIDVQTAAYADATSHGLVWRASEDWTTVLDTFTVQGTPRCVTNVTASTSSVAYGGGTITLTMTAPAGCAWTVTTDQDWLVPGSPASGVGSGSMAVGVALNVDEARDGHVVVGGRVVSIAQDGRPQIQCEASLSPTGNDHMAQIGGSSNFDVNVTDSSCGWGAWSNTAWIHVLAGGGEGWGQVTCRS